MKQSLPDVIGATCICISDAFSRYANLNIHLQTPKFDAAIDVKTMFVDLGASFPPTEAPSELPEVLAIADRSLDLAPTTSAASPAASITSPAKHKGPSSIAPATFPWTMGEAARKRLVVRGSAKRDTSS